MLYPDLPRGAITEISGAASSGRTSAIYSILAKATADNEFCALLDSFDTFDPLSAAHAGIELGRLLWIRGDGRLDHAFKAADLVLHSGGFGIVVLDLCEAAARDLNRIPLSYWYRFRGAVEHAQSRFVVSSHVPLVKSCARFQLEMKRERVIWRGLLFGGIESTPQNRKHYVRLAG